MAFSTVVLVVLLTTVAPVGMVAPAAVSAAEAAQAAPENDGFYSGNVVEVTSDHVKVSRTILNKPPELRTFQINPETKVEGKLKEKSRVTVRYAPGDDGDVALSILVRPEKSAGAKKK